ncbi:hypothetical protein I302_105037 [Kwoniella bestiolae CBS 10118]|uniref:tRNA adenylyltransferase n=1 Tax=Kwoniella bestiolae CBS 10118 TaxID=1296100 RepID=A0A1B9FR23_9TREE|nr:tRNA adenylyltransferase [Kwoniella bestiolae CBS 10118]OCF21217.1 tRNA adenylyltransferase [Kwoniella bestiolae CBS 10118]
MARKVALNEVETRFVNLLDDFSRRLNPPVECRIAGGWVRDKLLSLPSHDLDIALSIPSGHAFAVEFVDYLKTKDITTGSVGKVAANPEQSKHLETGTTRILGLECDFVGLRSETYADSRIPQVKPGTPLEDASRRDLTINALFYNVSTREVEDFTERGLSDLENKIACTPLPPRQTFQDDPLRILRCIRFASRFNLKIEDHVMEAIKEEDVKSAIATKVSKERIGIEVNKMLQHDPFRAMSLINDLGLHPHVFTCDVNPPRQDAIASAQILLNLSQRFYVDEILWLATAATPFNDLVVKRKGKDVPAASIVISEGLKLSTDTKNSVTNLFEAVKIVNPDATVRSEIGTWMQNPCVKPWQRSLTWSAVMEIVLRWTGQWDDNAEEVAKKYEEFRGRIEELGLPDAIDKPLLLNGTELQKLLSISPSPLLQTIRQALNIWQLDHPQGTKEECEVWLKEMWEGQGRAEWEKNSQPKKIVKGEKRKR